MIVLFSDGENNVRPDPLTVAQAAADRGIRIVTIGVGTAAGATLDLDGFKVQSSLDEAALRQIADTTKGAYYAGADAGSGRDGRLRRARAIAGRPQRAAGGHGAGRGPRACSW